jgi:hypothetical protein
MKFVAAVMLATALTMTGCAGQSVKGASHVVETSTSSKPDWVEKRVIERDGLLFFVGTVASVRDLALGEEQAEYQAKKTLASSIRETFQREFSAATTGSNSSRDGGALGLSIESALSAATDQVRVIGAWPVERYWERVETQLDDGVASSYNVAVLVRIARPDYDKAKAQVLDAAANADQVRANEEAKEALARVRRQLTRP